MPLILVLDIGTGGIHVSLINSVGLCVSSAYEEIRYENDGYHGGKTFCADHLFDTSMAMARAVLSNVSENERILGVSVTSQRHGMVLLDKAGDALYGCPNVDARVDPKLVARFDEDGEEIYRVTARYPRRVFPALRLVWFRENTPQLFDQIDTFLMINDWFSYMLCGRQSIELTNGAETLLFDLDKSNWSEALIERFGLDSLRLPPIVQPGTIVGYLRKDIAGSLELPTSTPVIAAPADTQCALLGCGALSVGDTVAVNGSTTPVCMVVEEPIRDDQRRVYTDPYLPERWIVESNCGKTGIIYRKFKQDLEGFLQVIGVDCKECSTLFDTSFEAVPAAQAASLPFLGPSIADVSRQENIPTSIFMKEDSNPFLSLGRGIIENIAFAVVGNAEQLERVTHRKATRLILTGGGASNGRFKRIVAALCMDHEVYESRTTETTAVGAAISGFVAVGFYESFEEASRKMTTELLPLSSDLLESEQYRERYQDWVSQHAAMAGLRAHSMIGG